MSSQPRFSLYSTSTGGDTFNKSLKMYIINTPNDLARLVTLDELKHLLKHGTCRTRDFACVDILNFYRPTSKFSRRIKSHLGHFRELREIIDYIQVWELLDV